jgi:hypothetical protein
MTVLLRVPTPSCNILICESYLCIIDRKQSIELKRTNERTLLLGKENKKESERKLSSKGFPLSTIEPLLYSPNVNKSESFPSPH